MVARDHLAGIELGVSVAETLAQLLEDRIALASQNESQSRCDPDMRVALSRLADRRSGTITCFDALQDPAMPLRRFIVHQLRRHAGCAEACYVLAAVYLDRLLTVHKQTLTLNFRNAHRLVLVGIVVASKFIDDDRCLNSHYAKVGGLETEELNKLELRFVQLLGWDAFVSMEHYEAYRSALVPMLVISDADNDTDDHMFPNVCDEGRVEMAKCGRFDDLISFDRISPGSISKIKAARVKHVIDARQRTVAKGVGMVHGLKYVSLRRFVSRYVFRRKVRRFCGAS